MPSEVQVRVLRPHESVLISNNIDKVQITLFRALPSLTSSESPPEQPQPSYSSLEQQKQISIDSGALPWDSVSKDKITDNVITNNDNNIIADVGGEDTANTTSTENNVNNTERKVQQECSKEKKTNSDPFYDTCAVAVYNEENTLRGGLECDYVGLGRVLSDCHGLQYIPHAVITGNEVIGNGYCSYNIKRSQHDLQQQESWEEVQDEKEANIFAAGDTIEVDFDYLMNCKGILVGVTQYNNNNNNTERQASSTHNTTNDNNNIADNEDAKPECPVYYILRESNSKQPLCLIPLHVHTNTFPTIIALQLRPLHFAHGETMWEVNALQECIPPRDVKHVVLALQDIAHDLFTLQCNDVEDDLRVIVKSRDEEKEEEGDNQEQQEIVQTQGSNCFSHYCVIDGQRVQIVGDKDNEENDEIINEDGVNGELKIHLTNLELVQKHEDAHNESKVEVDINYGNIKDTSTLLTPEQKELYIHLKTQENAEFVELLANVPHVTRTGRQQYNVGYACQAVHHMTEERTTKFINKYHKINKALSSNKFVAVDNEDSVRNDEDVVNESNDVECNIDIDRDEGNDEDDEDQDISEHNEILEEALRVAVPEYTRTRLVRYDNKAYNYGGNYHALAEHLVQHRASYAHQLAEQKSNINNEHHHIITNNLPGNISANNNANCDGHEALVPSKNAKEVIITPPLFAPHGLFANSCQELLMLQRIGALDENDSNNRPPLPPEFEKRKDSNHEADEEKRRKSSVTKRKKSKNKRSKSKKRKNRSSRYSSKNKKRSKSKSKSKRSNKSKSKKGKKSSTKEHENESHKEETDESNAKSDRTRHRSTSKQATKRKASHSPSRVADTM